jgi:hypothetical protein
MCVLGVSDSEFGLQLALGSRMANRSTKQAHLPRNTDSVHDIAQMTHRELLRSPRCPTTSVVVPQPRLALLLGHPTEIPVSQPVPHSRLKLNGVHHESNGPMTRSPVSQALVIIKQGISAPPRGDSLTKRLTQPSPKEQVSTSACWPARNGTYARLN